MENITISNYNSSNNSGNTVNLTLSENGNNSLVEIKIPDKNYNYGDGNSNLPKNIENTKQYLVTASSSINNSISEDFNEYYLNYDLLNNSVTWKPQISKNKDNKICNEENTFREISKEVFTLNTCINNLGINQISWNVNQDYEILESNDKQLYVDFLDKNDIDLDILFNVKYLKLNNPINLKNKIKIIKDNLGYKCIFENGENFEIFKLNHIEIDKFKFPENKGEIHFYFIGNYLKSNTIEKIKIYNENILNNHSNKNFLNLSNNKNFLNLSNDKSITINKNKIIEGDKNKFNSIFRDNYEELYYKNFNDLFIDNKLILELEGCSGNKAEITLGNNDILISNGGYNYNKNDILRIKNPYFKDTFYFKVLETNKLYKRSNKLVENIINKGHNKSNIIKYSVGKKESLFIKNLGISGSINSEVIIQIIEIKNIFSKNPKKYVLNEFIFNNTYINENKIINKIIKNNFGSQIYLQIKKSLKCKIDEDSLNLSLDCDLIND
uniref:Uncharacterized protein n=1 Tax=Mimiviridae sp. ChoanoV1 TaxID=2596887 RepID=A0A5B8II75_9VIRU|nr:hypothetical protein 5_42 [Mimiviridae sp. ChoanoV1]